MEAIRIRLDHITKIFQHRLKGEVFAVNDVSLDVEPGEFLTLLGPSGCGKTTTLRMVAGFERPDRGRIYIGAEDVTDQMVNQRNIGFVFQNYALFPHLSVYENVAYGLRVKGMTSAEMERRVEKALSLIGLSGYERQFPHQLSGGEQQRVALARAIVIEPRVLLFDEPLSNLDAKLRVYMRGEIRRLQKSLAITAVYVTHDQEEAMAISDHIAVMNEGKIVQIGTAEELYNSPQSPFVAQFIGKINRLPGVLKEEKEGEWVVTIFGRSYPCLRKYQGLQSGQSVMVYIRPEAVQLSAEPGDGRIAAIVMEKTFLGEKVDYLLDVQDHPVSATSYNLSKSGTFALKQKVGVGFSPSAIILLPGEEKT